MGNKETTMEVKLDNISAPLLANKPKKEEDSVKMTDVKQEDITVTNHLSKYVNAMIAENNPPDETNRVLEMKRRIDNNNYKVDTDQLATKLFEQVFAKNIG